VPVLFSEGTAGVLLHELVGHSVEADLVISGDSALAELEDAVITTRSLHVVDDPSRFDLPGAFSHDDEGIAAKPISIVSDGRLVGWLCDREGGERLNVVAGRARRASWDLPPSARLSNLVVEAGDTEPEALERDLKQGLVVTRLGAATVDPVSNRVVLRVERGWEIHNGRRRRPLATVELTGSVLEVLAHLDPSLGSDATADWRLGWCVKNGVPLPTGSESPSILAHRLEVL
jgi:TldD protein